MPKPLTSVATGREPVVHVEMTLEQKRQLDAEKREQKKADKRQREDQKQQCMVEFARESEWISTITEAPTYYPSVQEFQDPIAYIRKIQPEASQYGICKIVPPVHAAIPASTVLLSGSQDKRFTFTARSQELRCVKWANWKSGEFLDNTRKYTILEYEIKANDFSRKKFGTTGVLPPRLVEAEYWRELLAYEQRQVKEYVDYGNDVEGSCFASHVDDPLAHTKWNLKVLPRADGSALRFLKGQFPGVTTPMLYIGMLYASFAWHIEDHYMYSINFHHLGAPKTWYGVPASHADCFEATVKAKVYTEAMQSELRKGVPPSEVDNKANAILLGKNTMCCPKVLLDNGVRVVRALQHAGEYVVTFPRAYHAGFSTGFNCGEAVNFATGDWFPYAADCAARYRRLKRMQVIPHEQLLCTAACDVLAGKEVPQPCHQQRSDQYALVSSFLRMMRMQHQMRYTLHLRGAQQAVMLHLSCSTPCSTCHDYCYVAVVIDNGGCDPRCLRCAVADPQCQKDVWVLCSAELGQLEQLARQWEVYAAAPYEGPEVPLVDGLTEATNYGSDMALDGDLTQSFVWHTELQLNSPADSKPDQLAGPSPAPSEVALPTATGPDISVDAAEESAGRQCAGAATSKVATRVHPATALAPVMSVLDENTAALGLQMMVTPEHQHTYVAISTAWVSESPGRTTQPDSGMVQPVNSDGATAVSEQKSSLTPLLPYLLPASHTPSPAAGRHTSSLAVDLDDGEADCIVETDNGAVYCIIENDNGAGSCGEQSSVGGPEGLRPDGERLKGDNMGHCTRAQGTDAATSNAPTSTPPKIPNSTQALPPQPAAACQQAPTLHPAPTTAAPATVVPPVLSQYESAAPTQQPSTSPALPVLPSLLRVPPGTHNIPIPSPSPFDLALLMSTIQKNVVSSLQTSQEPDCGGSLLLPAVSLALLQNTRQCPGSQLQRPNTSAAPGQRLNGPPYAVPITRPASLAPFAAMLTSAGMSLNPTAGLTSPPLAGLTSNSSTALVSNASEASALNLAAAVSLNPSLPLTLNPFDIMLQSPAVRSRRSPIILNPTAHRTLPAPLLHSPACLSMPFAQLLHSPSHFNPCAPVLHSPSHVYPSAQRLLSPASLLNPSVSIFPHCKSVPSLCDIAPLPMHSVKDFLPNVGSLPIPLKTTLKDPRPADPRVTPSDHPSILSKSNVATQRPWSAPAVLTTTATSATRSGRERGSASQQRHPTAEACSSGGAEITINRAGIMAIVHGADIYLHGKGMQQDGISKTGSMQCQGMQQGLQDGDSDDSALAGKGVSSTHHHKAGQPVRRSLSELTAGRSVYLTWPAGELASGKPGLRKETGSTVTTELPEQDVSYRLQALQYKANVVPGRGGITHGSGSIVQQAGSVAQEGGVQQEGRGVAAEGGHLQSTGNDCTMQEDNVDMNPEVHPQHNDDPSGKPKLVDGHLQQNPGIPGDSAGSGLLRRKQTKRQKMVHVLNIPTSTTQTKTRSTNSTRAPYPTPASLSLRSRASQPSAIKDEPSWDAPNQQAAGQPHTRTGTLAPAKRALRDVHPQGSTPSKGHRPSDIPVLPQTTNSRPKRRAAQDACAGFKQFALKWNSDVTGKPHDLQGDPLAAAMATVHPSGRPGRSSRISASGTDALNEAPGVTAPSMGPTGWLRRGTATYSSAVDHLTPLTLAPAAGKQRRTAAISGLLREGSMHSTSAPVELPCADARQFMAQPRRRKGPAAMVTSVTTQEIPMPPPDWDHANSDHLNAALNDLASLGDMKSIDAPLNGADELAAASISIPALFGTGLPASPQEPAALPAAVITSQIQSPPKDTAAAALHSKTPPLAKLGPSLAAPLGLGAALTDIATATTDKLAARVDIIRDAACLHPDLSCLAPTQQCVHAMANGTANINHIASPCGMAGPNGIANLNGMANQSGTNFDSMASHNGTNLNGMANHNEINLDSMASGATKLGSGMTSMRELPWGRASPKGDARYNPLASPSDPHLSRQPVPQSSSPTARHTPINHPTFSLLQHPHPQPKP